MASECNNADLFQVRVPYNVKTFSGLVRTEVRRTGGKLASTPSQLSIGSLRRSPGRDLPARLLRVRRPLPPARFGKTSACGFATAPSDKTHVTYKRYNIGTDREWAGHPRPADGRVLTFVVLGCADTIDGPKDCT
jgi:hypothetical protein